MRAEKLHENTRRRPSGCLEWAGAVNRDGYGVLKLNGKGWRAHRLSWALNFGPIPPGMVIHHVCDNPTCVAPSHLSLGTQQSNQLDKVRKGRQAIRENNGRSKLTENDIVAIRERLSCGIAKMAIAEEFGVSARAIYKIDKGVTWK